MFTVITLPIFILITLIAAIFVLVINFRSVKKPIKELDFRAVASQLIALTIWIVLSVNIFIPDREYENSITPLLIFSASVIVGIILIRSISREIQVEDTVRQLVAKLQKNNSRLKVLDKQKTEFVSLASHQLRGPVAVIRGYASILLEGDFGNLTKKQRIPVERILRSSEALGFLISDYLEVTRIEKGEMEYIIEDVNLTELISSLAEEFSGMASSSGIDMTFLCDEGGRDMNIRGDKVKLRQIFSNLIDNAVKYTSEGSVEVRCQRKNDGVMVSIKDTGIGISKERLSEIFSKFIRTEEAKKMNVIGTGLGLFLAKVMTEAQDGKIWVESEGIGKGSTFFVWFPSRD